jgi:nitrite reductase/ring-hydroxylating ferredoxin subunit
MSRFVKVATIDEMAEERVKCVEVEGQKIALFDVEGAFHALSDTCTHRGGPLSEGELEGAEIVCPWHGARFDVKTGAVLGPPAPTGIRSYPVRVTGKDILIEV